MVQYCGQLLQHSAIAGDNHLWDLLLTCLGEHDALARKQALHVLEAAAAHLQQQNQQQLAEEQREGSQAVGPDGGLAAADHTSEAAEQLRLAAAPWALFIKLYDTVESTSVTLFEVSHPTCLLLGVFVLRLSHSLWNGMHHPHRGNIYPPSFRHRPLPRVCTHSLTKT